MVAAVSRYKMQSTWLLAFRAIECVPRVMFVPLVRDQTQST